MQTKIDKLRTIIQENRELSIYNESVMDKMSESDFIHLIDKILIDFDDFFEKSDRPDFFTQLQLLRNLFDSDGNPYYPQSKI
jgi:hypothetical protein